MAVLTNQERLEAAESAYHDLMTGNAVTVFVDQNGERVEYARAKAGDLYSYIIQLRGLIAPAGVTIPRPLGFVF